MPAEKKPSSGEESSWSFDSQGDHAVDRGQRTERIAALAVAALWIGLIFYNSGLGYAIRGAALFGLGVAAIWWPDALSQFHSLRPSLRSLDWEAMKGGRPSLGSARIAGWLILILPVIIWGVAKLIRVSG
ncbi:hypothetical protein [Haloferula sp. BvORR071]|uniref:hypothetical protein n=1 Tax=Haloferula sp. BvORR071 TaxID=1396141 RepID=UPI00054DC7D3|nr:hypothetical protein [Haloferula sp. BvORR071]